MIGDNMMDNDSNNRENDLKNLPEEEEDMDMDADYGLNDNQEDSVNGDAEGNISQIRKRRLMKKAPDAPKRFKSAYICFVTEKMDNVKKNMPADIKVTEVMKTLAYMWKNLPPLEKMEYEKQAEVDKTRYFEEMAQYSGPLQVPNKRQKKPPGAPKRAMSAFLSFSQQMRPQIRAMYPDLKNTDISGVLAQKWHNASEEEKRPHLERELREREKYHEDMAQWKEEEQKRQLDAAEERKKNNAFVKNTVDFLDLPSSTSLWETLDSDGLSENVSEQNDGPEHSMPQSMASSSSTSNHRMSSHSMIPGKDGGNMYEHPFHSLASFHSGSALTNKLMGGLHKNYSGLQPKGSLKMNQQDNEQQSSRSKSNQNNNNNHNNNSNNNSNNNMAAIPPSIAIPMNSSNSTTPTNNSSSALPTPMTIYPTSTHPAAMTAAALPDNRYYAMQYPMVAHPEGQVPYASFSMYPQEYAPYMTYYVPSEKGASPYVRYPYMGPLYARQFATAANQSQGEIKDNEDHPTVYPGSYGFPGHPLYPPEYMAGAQEGYWQYVRKMPTPTSAGNSNHNNNNNNNNSNGAAKESASRAAGNAAAVPHYLYELPPEYLTVPPAARMSAAAVGGEKGMEFLPYPYAYAAPLAASYPLPQASGKSSKKGQNHSAPSLKASSHGVGMMMGGLHPAPAPSNGRHESFPHHSHSNVAETLRAIHRSGLSGQD